MCQEPFIMKPPSSHAGPALSEDLWSVVEGPALSVDLWSAVEGPALSVLWSVVEGQGAAVLPR